MSNPSLGADNRGGGPVRPGRVAALAARLGLVICLCLPRITAHAETTQLLVGVHQNMHAVLIAPDGPGPYPGILLLHTSGGLKSADLDYAQQLAKLGYVTLVPSFLDAYGITARSRRETFLDDAQPIYADLVAALQTLQQQPKVAGRKLGAIGFSNGGYFAMWLAATGKVQAGVSYYGALSGAGTDRNLDHFHDIFTHDSSPVLILHGTDDDTVPARAAQHLDALLEAAGSPHELKLYEGAGHQFERMPGLAADDAAAADAWQRTQAFFARYLN